MKKRLQEIEEEAGALRDLQAKVVKQMGQGLFITLSTCSYIYLMLYIDRFLKFRILALFAF